MNPLLLLVVIEFLQCLQIFGQLELGRVFPIPLLDFESDPDFPRCPTDDGVYRHTSNCSLFHLCSFDVHRVYACMPDFVFNPISRRCQYWPFEGGRNCDIQEMIEANFAPIDWSFEDDSAHHRKSERSICINPGLYADVLDCSLFHYCHGNRHHEILKCPEELHFDPKTLICSSPKLVNCQYEPPITLHEQKSNICRDHPPGTFLPVMNSSDKFIICRDDGSGIVMQCKTGLIYNALTTSCEKGSCTIDSSLCQNEGDCIDDPSAAKGFQCICHDDFYGDFCEQMKQSDETTEQVDSQATMDVSAAHLVQKNETTHLPYVDIHSNPRQANTISTDLISNYTWQDTSAFENTSLDESTGEESIKVVLIVVLALIGLFAIASIGFGSWKLARLFLYPSLETVGRWKTLPEPSKV